MLAAAEGSLVEAVFVSGILISMLYVDEKFANYVLGWNWWPWSLTK